MWVDHLPEYSFGKFHCETIQRKYGNCIAKAIEQSDDEDTAPTDSTDSNTRQQDITKTQVLPRRIGGRRETKRRSDEKSSMLLTSLKNEWSRIRSIYVKWGTSSNFYAFIALFLYFCQTFSSTSPQHVYYQSEIIERCEIGPDGILEKSRDVSYKSNILDFQRQSTHSSKEMNEVEMRRFVDQFRKSSEEQLRQLLE